VTACTALHCFVLCCNMLHSTSLCSGALFAWYCTVRHCIVLRGTIIFCTALIPVPERENFNLPRRALHYDMLSMTLHDDSYGT
jgi:hypothetical protein